MANSRKSLLATTALIAAGMWGVGAAHAQPVTGVYVGAGAGLNILQSSKDTIGTTPATQANYSISYNLGGVGVLSIGYGFGNGLRVELEGNLRYNEVDRAERNSRADGRRGKSLSYGPMVNAIYEFALGPVQPYLGAGVGYLWQDSILAGGRSYSISGREGAFAYQGIAGLAFPIAAVPGLAFTSEYRFTGSSGHDYRGSGTNGIFSSDNFNHSILAGLRYNFGQVVAAPIAPPTQPTATARTYLVFFDFDRGDLTERARQIIAEAAAAAPRVSATRIEVAGHADRSGTPAYNQGLSQRRANNVAAELVRRGIARNQIAISAFGETRPLVPTADGVREPQNRRVEIVLR